MDEIVVDTDTGTVDPEENKTEITDEFIITTTVENGFAAENGVYTITAAGEYTLSGKLAEGRIIVNAPDQKVTLNLSGVSITSAENSPIYIEDADKVEISAKKDTYNEITDNRETKTEDVDGQGEGAIYSCCDLEIKGKGNLVVVGNYNNGIHTKDDLEIKNLNLKSTAYNNALKGNDSLTVYSGNITAVSVTGNGLKTENSDISSKGNQRGTVTISGGSIDIYAACDAIDASYDAVINATDESNPPSVNIFTGKYSSETGQVVSDQTTDMYLKIPSSYTSGVRYSVYFYNQDGGFSWANASYYSTGRSGRDGNINYYYRLSRPTKYSYFKIYAFLSSQTENSATAYKAVSGGTTVRAANNLMSVSSVSGSTVTLGGWSNYGSMQSGGAPGQMGQMGQPGGNNKNTEKTEYSSKGIKASNNIDISAGVIKIYSNDDAIHANSDTDHLIESTGAAGEGKITISGGDITINSSDDAIHADTTLIISGGTIKIEKSWEGLEAPVITISGGDITIKSSNDGVNASGSNSPRITISGGKLDVTVPTSGDTDGIDSNGAYTQTGGVVIVKGPGSAGGGMGGGAAALDTDGAVTLSGGTLIVFGGIEKTPSYSVTKTLCSSSVVSTGTHTVTVGGTAYTTTLTYSTSGCVVYSALGSATLK